MMVILKIPIVYLCLVVYWAVKAEPTPPEASPALVVDDEPEPTEPWAARRRRRPGLRRGPERAPVRARRARVTR